MFRVFPAVPAGLRSGVKVVSSMYCTADLFPAVSAGLHSGASAERPVLTYCSAAQQVRRPKRATHHPAAV